LRRRCQQRGCEHHGREPPTQPNCHPEPRYPRYAHDVAFAIPL
jgi:hypothetical protein